MYLVPRWSLIVSLETLNRSPQALVLSASFAYSAVNWFTYVEDPNASRTRPTTVDVDHLARHIAGGI